MLFKPKKRIKPRLRIIKPFDRKIIFEYSPNGKRIFQETRFQPDEKTIDYIALYDKHTNNRIKSIHFHFDGKTIDYINEYDPSTGNLIKKTNYQPDGITIKVEEEFDKDTGHLFNKIVNFVDKEENITHIDRKKVIAISEYSKDTGHEFKLTAFYPDGKTIKFVFEYDKDTEKLIKKIHFNPDDTIKEEITY